MKPIALLSGMFFLLAPLSLATTFPYQEGAKYLRVLLTIMIVALNLLFYRQFPLRTAGRALAVFIAFFLLSALWSDLPYWGLFHKGMFVLTCLSGFSIAYSASGAAQLRKSIHFLAVVASFAGILSFVLFIRNPEEATSQGRMALMGMNANAVGQTAAPFLLFIVYRLLSETRRSRKALLVFSTSLLVFVIVASGSRGAALMACVGVIPLLVPKMKNPKQMIAATLFLLILGFGTVGLAAEYETTRMFDEFTKNTRGGILRFAIRQFLISPVIGQGWLHHETSWTLVQSVYMQNLVETGILGSFLLAIFLLLTVCEFVRLRPKLNTRNANRDLYALSLSLTLSVLVHGLFESSTFSGPSANAFCLGMGVGMLDRLPEFRYRSLRRHARRIHSFSVSRVLRRNY